MTVHPAYPSNSSCRMVLGMVVSAFDVNLNARNLRLVTCAGIQTAWLPKGLVAFEIANGQVWKFDGEIVDLGEFGEQFEVSDAKPSLPPDQLMVAFLAYHVPGLSETRARRMSESLGSGLVDALVHNDIPILMRAHGGQTALQIAKLAVDCWREKVAYTRLVQTLYRYELTEQVLLAALKHYGQACLSKIHDDPYRLLAFAKLEPVDKAAIRHFGVRTEDARRLMGIVDAGVHALYDNGTVIFLQSHLAEAIQKLTDFDHHQIQAAINLSVQRGRLIKASDHHWMGDGYAEMERSVVRYLTNLERTAHKTSSESDRIRLPNRCDVSQAAYDAAEEHISVEIFDDDCTAFKFLECVAALFNSKRERYHIVAGSDALCRRIRAATGLKALAVHRVLEGGFAELGSVPAQRAIVIVSSSINFLSMSKLLVHLRATDRLLFVGRQRLHVSDHSLLLPALLAVDEIFRRHFPTHIIEGSDSPGTPALTANRNSYNPKDPDRHGTFWMSVSDHAFDRAIVGISHQLCQHGSVTIIVGDNNEKQYYWQLVEEAFAETTSPKGYRLPLISTADGLEFGESESTVVVVRDPKLRTAAWLHTALCTATARAVVVSTVELAYQFPTREVDETLSKGFLSRWHLVVTDQEQTRFHA